ncbi:MAG: hypothetical protein WA989_18045 [Henriciella sp.]|uniref:hypothetical protein n=1 Tax=Henriciella sp. TaxID=1968823 RepID=UPI003C718E70
MKLDLDKIDPKPLILAGLLGASLTLTGCLAAAAGGGYVAGEEIAEDDGDFDPLDEVDE